jgi:hypothetical protein
VTSAPAGDYLAAAIDRAHEGSWQTLDFLTRLERVATRVTLAWGSKTSLDLTAVTVR